MCAAAPHTHGHGDRKARADVAWGALRRGDNNRNASRPTVAVRRPRRPPRQARPATRHPRPSEGARTTHAPGPAIFESIRNTVNNRARNKENKDTIFFGGP
jgi:hypothetical protein